jgi:hypothetical protein
MNGLLHAGHTIPSSLPRLRGSSVRFTSAATLPFVEALHGYTLGTLQNCVMVKAIIDSVCHNNNILTVATASVRGANGTNYRTRAAALCAREHLCFGLFKFATASATRANISCDSLQLGQFGRSVPPYYCAADSTVIHCRT